jgi:hypothetical protein
MKKYESATFIKITANFGQISLGDDRYDRLGTASHIHISPPRPPSLTALILSAGSTGHELFNYLNLPNFRLLSITLAYQTNDKEKMFIASLIGFYHDTARNKVTSGAPSEISWQFQIPQHMSVSLSQLSSIYTDSADFQGILVMCIKLPGNTDDTAIH